MLYLLTKVYKLIQILILVSTTIKYTQASANVATQEEREILDHTVFKLDNDGWAVPGRRLTHCR